MVCGLVLSYALVTGSPGLSSRTMGWFSLTRNDILWLKRSSAMQNCLKTQHLMYLWHSRSAMIPVEDSSRDPVIVDSFLVGVVKRVHECCFCKFSRVGFTLVEWTRLRPEFACV